jgi:hypothetical protein
MANPTTTTRTVNQAATIRTVNQAATTKMATTTRTVNQAATTRMATTIRITKVDQVKILEVLLMANAKTKDFMVTPMTATSSTDV